MAETINGLYKTKVIKPGGLWKTLDTVEYATAEWVHWFNHRRLYSYCGDIPPAEAEHTLTTKSPRPPPRPHTRQSPDTPGRFSSSRGA